MNITLYTADVCGNPKNLCYPHKHSITDEATLKAAVQHDYTAVCFRDGVRRAENFLHADCVIADVDNTHTDNPNEWIDTTHVAKAFPGVMFAAHASRNHKQEKDGKAARPRFHVIFPIEPVETAEEYAAIMRRLIAHFSYFDAGAKDAARFFFGTSSPKGGVQPGSKTLTAFLRELTKDQADQSYPFGETMQAPEMSSRNGSRWKNKAVIPEGRRNDTLHETACSLLIRFGETPKARAEFDECVEFCRPPLPKQEVERIWMSACQFTAKVRAREDYVSPEEFEKELHLHKKGTVLPQMHYRPEDFTDVGQAQVFAETYEGEMHWCSGVGWLAYDGSKWCEDPCDALEQSAHLTNLQREEAMQLLAVCKGNLAALGIPDPESVSGKMVLSPQQEAAMNEWLSAKGYATYVDSRRMSARLKATTEVAQPRLSVPADKLDADPYLLNTPAGTVDLADEGELRHHDPEDLITKLTAASPGADEHSSSIWQKTLRQLFLSDEEIIAYVQQLCGNMLIGKVYSEELILAIGSGANGKSTFFNAIRMVMGDYAGVISSDVLLAGTVRNTAPEKATLRGLRFALASELPMGGRLNANLVKQLCSTDMIRGEAKYKAPVSFTPTHTLVVLTNNLPAIPDTDEGTWRRIRLIPFNAVFKGDRDCKNFAEMLYEESGSAILDWMIAGALRVIAQGMHVTVPESIITLTNSYRMDNDWVLRFLQECTVKVEDGKVTTKELYAACVKWCTENDMAPPKSNPFGRLMTAHGYKSVHTHDRYYSGLCLQIKSK